MFYGVLPIGSFTLLEIDTYSRQQILQYQVIRQIVFCLFGCVYGVDRAESCRVVSFGLGFCFSFLVASGVAVDQLRIGLGGDRDKRLPLAFGRQCRA